jgi:hypothetical protein
VIYGINVAISLFPILEIAIITLIYIKICHFLLIKRITQGLFTGEECQTRKRKHQRKVGLLHPLREGIKAFLTAVILDCKIQDDSGQDL